MALDERSWSGEVPRQGEGWGSELVEGSWSSAPGPSLPPLHAAPTVLVPSASNPGLGRVTHVGQEDVSRGLCLPRLLPLLRDENVPRLACG